MNSGRIDPHDLHRGMRFKLAVAAVVALFALVDADRSSSRTASLLAEVKLWPPLVLVAALVLGPVQEPFVLLSKSLVPQLFAQQQPHRHSVAPGGEVFRQPRGAGIQDHIFNPQLFAQQQTGRHSVVADRSSLGDFIAPRGAGIQDRLFNPQLVAHTTPPTSPHYHPPQFAGCHDRHRAFIARQRRLPHNGW
ncbi:hypothetical protein T492DRAFT_1152622 [Pavlovales sp. CCMP2436]|nr:hypothetical protein T492DRAFT_1152622 [Pavlovales sp. CCMP2436]